MCCGCVEEKPFVSVLIQTLVQSQDSGQLMRHCALTEGDIYSHILDLVRSPEGSEFNADGTFKTTKRTLRVTSLIKPMFPPFDADVVANECVARSLTSSTSAQSDTAPKTKKSYLMDWAIKRITGSAAHASIELLLALYTLQTVTSADFDKELDIEQIVMDIIDKDAGSCRRNHPKRATIDTDEDDDPYCDQCRFLVTDAAYMCGIIVPYVHRLIRLSFFKFVEDLLSVAPDSLVIASEKSMVVPLNMTSDNPLYVAQETQPELLSGTADLFLSTTAQISSSGTFVAGTERRFYVCDWKTTQHTSASLNSQFALDASSASSLVPFRYMASETRFCEMQPTTRNKHTTQALTYSAMAKRLYGMNCDAFICMLKYSPKSARGSGYYLSYSTDEALKSAFRDTVLSMFS
jgi:hypothetical protein